MSHFLDSTIEYLDRELKKSVKPIVPLFKKKSGVVVKDISSKIDSAIKNDKKPFKPIESEQKNKDKPITWL